MNDLDRVETYKPSAHAVNPLPLSHQGKLVYIYLPEGISPYNTRVVLVQPCPYYVVVTSPVQFLKAEKIVIICEHERLFHNLPEGISP